MSLAAFVLAAPTCRYPDWQPGPPPPRLDPLVWPPPPGLPPLPMEPHMPKHVLAKLEAELKVLKQALLVDIPKEIASAASQGDLSENA